MNILQRKNSALAEDLMVFPCGMSRSGTTLLATVLDSHSQISLGYELIPPKLPGPSTLIEALEEGLNLSNGDFEKCGTALRDSGEKSIGLFMTRSYRAGISAGELRNILKEMQEKGLHTISSFKERLYVAFMIAKRKHLNESTNAYGFKFNSPSVSEAFKVFPGGYFVYIVRDPRDVVASHIKRGFERTTQEICIAWNNYIQSFENFREGHEDRSIIIRYEDLVSRPHETINKIFRILPLELEQSIFRFYESKASVHKGGHPNAENLKKNFFTSSIGRWGNELSSDDIDTIQKSCGKAMKHYHYHSLI